MSVRKKDTWQIQDQGEKLDCGSTFEYNHDCAGRGWAGVNQNGIISMFHISMHKDKAQSKAEKWSKGNAKSSVYDMRGKGYGLRGVTGRMIQ